MSRNRRQKHWIIIFFTHRWQAKLGSLLVAALLFFYVQHTRTTTRMVNLRVVAPTLPAHKSLISSSSVPSYLPVRFSGPTEIMDFNTSDYRLLLTHPDPDIGQNNFRVVISPELPDRLEASFRNEVSINIDAEMVRELPIEPSVSYDLPPNVTAGYLQIRPATIRVRGPRSILSEMDRLTTESVTFRAPQPLMRMRVILAQLPEYVSVATGEPGDIELQQRFLGLVPEGSVEEELRTLELKPSCSNPDDHRGLVMRPLGIESVRVTYSAPSVLRADRLQVRLFCPVFIDPDTRSVRPSSHITNLPLQVRERESEPVAGLRIHSIQPTSISVQFERPVIHKPAEIRQGLQEHLIR